MYRKYKNGGRIAQEWKYSWIRFIAYGSYLQEFCLSFSPDLRYRFEQLAGCLKVKKRNAEALFS